MTDALETPLPAGAREMAGRAVATTGSCAAPTSRNNGPPYDRADQNAGDRGVIPKIGTWAEVTYAGERFAARCLWPQISN